MSRRVRVLVALLGLARAEDEAPAEEPPAVVVELPTSVDGAHFFEPFGESWEGTWKVSKDAEFTGSWKREPYAEGGDDHGLVVGDPAKRHAVSTIFAKPIDPKGKGLVIQYELQLKNGLQCGGAYIKLLTASEALSHDGFKADTPYTIMFGPDKCGETNKVHFILRHKNPVSGAWEEKHLASPPVVDIAAKVTHLYTAIVGADNTVKLLVDNVEKASGSLLSDTDFKPPVNPPKEIDDPADKKPEDWIDEPKMDEPGATKPDDWDEDAPVQIPDPKANKPEGWLDDAPDMVPDPSAVTPDDWDAAEDGEWEAPLVKNPDCQKVGCGEWKAPLVSNPAYKGKWFAPKVDNPAYVGVWAPQKIANPDYFVDEAPHAMAPIGGIGIELWTMQDGILFDNLLLTDDVAAAKALSAKTFAKRKELETAASKKAEREAALAADASKGFLGKVTGTIKKGWFYAQDHPLIVAGSLFLGILPILLFCCMGGSKKDADDDDDADDDAAAPAPAPTAKGKGKQKAPPTPAPEDDGAGDSSDDEPVKDVTEEKRKGGAKKRTPKAS